MSDSNAPPNDPPQSRAALTEQAKAILLAEALGDLKGINNEVVQLKRVLATMSGDLAQRKEWAQQLDLKIAELNALRVTELASAPMQAYAERFMRALAADIKRVVDAEAKDSLAEYIRRERLKVTLAAIAVAFCAGVLVGQII